MTASPPFHCVSTSFDELAVFPRSPSPGGAMGRHVSVGVAPKFGVHFGLPVTGPRLVTVSIVSCAFNSLLRTKVHTRSRPSSVATRPVALLVALSFAPHIVSPAFAANEGSLRWVVGWLVDEAHGNEKLVLALDVAEGSRGQGDAAYLAAILDSYSTNAAGAESDQLLLSIAGHLVRFCAPQVAPPSVIAISIASFGKQAPCGAIVVSPGALDPQSRDFASSTTWPDDPRPAGFSRDYSQRSQGP